ncbi:MAG: RNA polymerase sigma factor [Ginsengibacter sp.]
MPTREDYKITWGKIKNGDEDALTELYQQHYLSLINYGRTIINDHDLVNDCFMQMLIDFWDKRNSLSAVENVRSYLMTSLRRAIIYKLETDKRRDLKQEESKAMDETHQWSYEEHLIKIQSNSNLKQKISRAMDKLTVRQKELVQLKYFDDLNYDEIAERCGITKRTAYNIIFDALKILKKELYTEQSSSFHSVFLLLV